MQILHANVSQLDWLVPLFDAYRIFYGLPSDPEAGRNFLRERFSKDDSVIYLAMDGEQNQALGFVQLYPMFSSLSMQRLWILNDLFVLPHARKRGVATGLTDQCRRLARETGAKGLQLETATDNINAQRLYEQTGFTRISSVFYYLPT
jgi:ribosomal protein S18 acetylase RimI-like enzyme